MDTSDFVKRLTGCLKPEEPAGPPKPVKAYAWARVSTPGQEERGLSIPEQFREIRRYAEKANIEILTRQKKSWVSSGSGSLPSEW